MKEFQEEEGQIVIYGAREHNLKNIDFTGCKGLKKLRISSGGLKKLNLQECSKLKELEVNAGKLTDLKLPEKIQKITFENLLLTSLDLSKYNKLEEVYFEGEAPKLEKIKCVNTSLKIFDVDRFEKLEKLRELALDYTEEDIKPLFAKFKELADKKQEITDADIRALVAGTMVENPEGFHFDDLQLQTHADNDIEALVSLANMDGEKVEFNATGQGSVEAIFNAIDKFFNQSVRLVSYTIDAVTDGIDAQARVLVTVENRDTETIFNAAGLDFDVLKASAIAYINANTFVQKENAGEMGHSVSYRDMPSV